MAQRNYRERVATAHFSLGFFSFLRGGGTGASPPAAPSLSFFTTFFTIFFLGASDGGLGWAGDGAVVGVAGVSGAVGASGVGGVTVSVIEDSICAAVVDLPLGGTLTPICASDTAPTGGVGTSGSSTARREFSGAAGDSATGGDAAVTVGVSSSRAMMSEASAAASSSSLSGVGSGSAAAGGLSFSLPAGLRRSSADLSKPRLLRCLLGRFSSGS